MTDTRAVFIGKQTTGLFGLVKRCKWSI